MRIQGGNVEHEDHRARRIVGPLLLACLGAAALLAGAAAAADPGDLDTSFSGDGRQTTDVDGSDDGEAIAVQPDGKLVVAGTAGEGIGVVRYEPDGDLDTGFGGGDGKVITSFPDTRLEGGDVALQPDGKIVVAGSYEDVTDPMSPVSDFMAIRYTPDGQLDDSFAGDGIATVDFGGPSDFGSGIAIDDGGIVLGGTVGEPMVSDLGVARLDENGDPDNSFSNDGRDTADAGGGEQGNDIAVQENGEPIIVGSALPDDEFVLARFRFEGGLDSAFSGDGIETTRPGGSPEASAIVVQSDSKPVVAGRTNGDFALARYGENGGLDTSFGDHGIVVADFAGEDAAHDLALDLHGRIVVAGETVDAGSNGRFALARYESAGTLDVGFSSNGKLTTDFGSDFDEANGVAIQDDGKIVAAGTSESDFAVARYLAEGGSCGGLDATIAGTAEDDELTGTLGDDVIDAGNGGDTITGLAGNDVICGGKGGDDIKGTNGNDDLRGESGADTMRGGKGRDKVRGSKGRDTMRGARGRDKLKGGPGGDFVRGGKARDKLRGGSGFDNCKGGPGKDRIKGC